MDINRMNQKQLKQYIRTYGKRANTRLVALKNKGYDSASKAYRYIERESYYYPFNYKITKSNNIAFNLNIKKLTENAKNKTAVLRHQAKEIQNFLNAKSSTIKGINKSFDSASKKLSERANKQVSSREVGQLFNAFDEAGLRQNIGSDQIINIYTRYIDDMDIEDIVSVVQDTTGSTVTDITTDINLQYFINKYHNALSVNIITEIVTANKFSSINEIDNIIQARLEEWNESEWNT